MIDPERLKIIVSQIIAWLIIIIVFGSACVAFNAVLHTGRAS